MMLWLWLIKYQFILKLEFIVVAFCHLDFLNHWMWKILSSRDLGTLLIFKKGPFVGGSLVEVQCCTFLVLSFGVCPSVFWRLLASCVGACWGGGVPSVAGLSSKLEAKSGAQNLNQVQTGRTSEISVAAKKVPVSRDPEGILPSPLILWEHCSVSLTPVSPRVLSGAEWFFVFIQQLPVLSPRSHPNLGSSFQVHSQIQTADLKAGDSPWLSQWLCGGQPLGNLLFSRKALVFVRFCSVILLPCSPILGSETHGWNSAMFLDLYLGLIFPSEFHENRFSPSRNGLRHFCMQFQWVHKSPFIYSTNIWMSSMCQAWF